MLQVTAVTLFINGTWLPTARAEHRARHGRQTASSAFCRWASAIHGRKVFIKHKRLPGCP